MNYEPNDVTAFKRNSQSDDIVHECSVKLFAHWLESNHDPKPKTYQCLLNYIKEVHELKAASEEIEEELIQGKVQAKDV